MSRDPREAIVGGTYHVTNRGNRKAAIFEDDRDRRRFLQITMKERQAYGVDICAGCLMGNHFHELVHTPNGNLSEFMGVLEGTYARYSNWRYSRVGHVFQGPFRRVVVEDDVQLLTALCYVFFNPVSAGIVRQLEDYRWSTYRATVGLEPVPSYLSLEWLETLFPSDSLADSQRRFRNLMAQANPVFAYFQQCDAEVDPEAVKRVVRSYVGEKLRVGTLPRKYRSVLRAPLPELFPAGLSAPARASAIHEAHVEHGYKLVEIARQLRLHPTTVSAIFRSICKSQNL